MGNSGVKVVALITIGGPYSAQETLAGVSNKHKGLKDLCGTVKVPPGKIVAFCFAECSFFVA